MAFGRHGLPSKKTAIAIFVEGLNFKAFKEAGR
jgi:hypothetical protein